MEQRKNRLLDTLVEAFKAESDGYAAVPTPSDAEGKRQLLRALMNVRAPRALDAETLRLQDAYLTERAAERGVVDALTVPTIAESLGSAHAHADTLSIWQGDITLLKCDAIVNAANSEMLGCFRPGHTCIDNCIHTYAGVQLRLACAEQMEALRRVHGRDYTQPTAVPMLTEGYNLPAKHVVHIVGPIVEDRLTPGLEADLAACYRNTLDLCAANGLKTVAFCGISTGVFRFPPDRAAEIAVKTVSDWLREHPGQMERVIFNVHKEPARQRYEALLA